MIMMVVLRTRKWMELFTIDVMIPNQNGNQDGENVIAVDLMSASIPKDWVLDYASNKQKSDMVLNDKQVFKFKDINYMQPEKVVLLNYSEVNWEESEKKPNKVFKARIYENT